MKYVALLRGINVGGNNIIKMVALKEAFLKSGFANVSTYIQSGNVLFESAEKNIAKITKIIEADLTKTFQYTAVVVVRSQMQMKDIVESAPKEWESRDDIRKYVGFLKESVSVQEAFEEIPAREGVDIVTTGSGVIYMTTLLNDLTKSSLNKLATKKIYQDMTIRNYNTVEKLLALMMS